MLSNYFMFDFTIWKSKKDLENCTQVFRNMFTSLPSNHYSHNILFHVHFHIHILNTNCHFQLFVTRKLENLQVAKIRKKKSIKTILHLILPATFVVSRLKWKETFFFNISFLHPMENISLKTLSRHQFFVNFLINLYVQVEFL